MIIKERSWSKTSRLNNFLEWQPCHSSVLFFYVWFLGLDQVLGVDFINWFAPYAELFVL